MIYDKNKTTGNINVLFDFQRKKQCKNKNTSNKKKDLHKLHIRWSL